MAKVPSDSLCPRPPDMSMRNAGVPSSFPWHPCASATPPSASRSPCESSRPHLLLPASPITPSPHLQPRLSWPATTSGLLGGPHSALHHACLSPLCGEGAGPFSARPPRPSPSPTITPANRPPVPPGRARPAGRSVLRVASWASQRGRTAGLCGWRDHSPSPAHLQLTPDLRTRTGQAGGHAQLPCAVS